MNINGREIPQQWVVVHSSLDEKISFEKESDARAYATWHRHGLGERVTVVQTSAPWAVEPPKRQSYALFGLVRVGS